MTQVTCLGPGAAWMTEVELQAYEGRPLGSVHVKGAGAPGCPYLHKLAQGSEYSIVVVICVHDTTVWRLPRPHRHPTRGPGPGGALEKDL